MRFSTTTEIDGPPEVVFAVLTDIDRWPEWTATVTRVERLGDAGTAHRPDDAWPQRALPGARGGRPQTAKRGASSRPPSTNVTHVFHHPFAGNGHSVQHDDDRLRR